MLCGAMRPKLTSCPLLHLNGEPARDRLMVETEQQVRHRRTLNSDQMEALEKIVVRGGSRTKRSKADMSTWVEQFPIASATLYTLGYPGYHVVDDVHRDQLQIAPPTSIACSCCLLVFRLAISFKTQFGDKWIMIALSFHLLCGMVKKLAETLKCQMINVI
jgi:hypothetical protein